MVLAYPLNSKNTTQVIRVRKNSKHAYTTTLDKELWCDIVVGADGQVDELATDLNYIHTIMLPLIGSQYIAQQAGGTHPFFLLVFFVSHLHPTLPAISVADALVSSPTRH